MDLVSLAVNAVSALSSIAVALVVYRFSKNQAKQQLTQAVRNAWITIDQVAISDPKALEIQSKIFFGDLPADQTLERWHALLAMNPIVSAWHLGQLDSSSAETVAAAEEILAKVLRHDVVRKIVLEEKIYEASFRARCEEIYARISAAEALERT